MTEEVALMPSGQFVKARSLFPELANISDPELRGNCEGLLNDCLALGPWQDPASMPFIRDPAAAAVDNVMHTRAVVAAACAMARALAETMDVRVDPDSVVCAALLHDASKWLEFAPAEDGAGTEYSALGKMLTHPNIAVALAAYRRLPEDIVHAIAAHSPRSKVPTDSPLAVIIHHADAAAADCARLACGLPAVHKAAAPDVNVR
jgi:putative nucleotidyltransferase with HDIG domain